MVRKDFDHLMNVIISPILEKTIKSSYEKANGQEVAKEDQVIDIPHIDFIFGDGLSFFKDCDPLKQRKQLIHSTVRS